MIGHGIITSPSHSQHETATQQQEQPDTGRMPCFIYSGPNMPRLLYICSMLPCNCTAAAGYVYMYVVSHIQVIISDVDVMWLRDPIPFFKKFPDADVLTSSDHLTPTIGGAETLEKYPDAGSAFNIGAH